MTWVVEVVRWLLSDNLLLDTVLRTPYTSPHDFTQMSYKMGITFIPIFQMKRVAVNPDQDDTNKKEESRF